MRKLCVALVAILFIGASCAQEHPTAKSLPAVGGGLERIGADARDATGHVERAKPHADEVGKTELSGASASLADLQLELAGTKSSYDRALTEVNAVTVDRDKTVQALADEQAHWIGYKSRVWAKWLIVGSLVGWLLAGVGGVALSTLLPGGGLLATLGTHVLQAIPLSQVFTGAAGLVRRMVGGGAAGQTAIQNSPAGTTINVNMPK